MFRQNDDFDGSDDLTWEQAQALQNQGPGLIIPLHHGIPEGDENSMASYESQDGGQDGGQNGGQDDGQFDVHDHSMSEDEDSVSNFGVEKEKLPEVEKPIIPVITAQGIGADLLKEQLAQVKEADKVSTKVSQPVAVGIDKYLKDSWYTTEMDKLAKQYPRVENIDHLKVPKLDTEVYQLVEQHVRNNDQSMQGVQKALIAGLSALAPVLDLAINRGNKDAELDPLTKNIMNGIQLVSYAVNGISSRRKEMLKPCLAPAYARVLTKGHDTTPDWLFGGDLLTTTKKCEAAKRIGEKVLRRKNQENQQKDKNQNNKRFKPNPNSSQGMLRANQFQQRQNQRFQGQQNFTEGQYQVPQQQQFQAPQQYYQQQGFQKQQRFPRNPQQNQGGKKNNSFPK